MKLKDTIKINKGMVFAGCSFTWGQGLYYYTGLPTLAEPPPNTYDHSLLTDSHIEYMKSIRFPRLVATHFDSYEICQPFNGGATYSINNWWQRSFMSIDDENKTKHSNHKFTIPYYSYQEIDCVIYQVTQWHRAQSPYQPNQYPEAHCDVMSNPNFKIWLENNNLTLDSYIEQSILNDLEDIKNFLKTFENYGIKTYIIAWPVEHVKYILKDEWTNNKLIMLNYKNKEYSNIWEMMCEHNELEISKDTEWFEVPPTDHHPSKLCHRVIADNIIKHLEKEK